ncbi:MAG: ATP-binding protein [Oscillospiraceae bacterium]|nr:ATP-binding protein [Oscillospiraceae bacterium]
MKTIVVPAKTEELDTVNAVIDAELEVCGCSPKVQMQIALAVEEIFVNIASYAYNPEIGEAEIEVGISGTPPTVTIRFLDHGKPFNPLAKEDADTTLPAEERGIGGLGILLVKKNMDQVSYSYEAGKNILTIQKKL